MTLLFISFGQATLLNCNLLTISLIDIFNFVFSLYLSYLQDLFIGFRDFVPAVINSYGGPSDDQLIDISRRILGIPNVLDDDSLREYSCPLASKTCTTRVLIQTDDFWKLCFQVCYILLKLNFVLIINRIIISRNANVSDINCLIVLYISRNQT